MGGNPGLVQRTRVQGTAQVTQAERLGGERESMTIHSVYHSLPPPPLTTLFLAQDPLPASSPARWHSPSSPISRSRPRGLSPAGPSLPSSLKLLPSHPLLLSARVFRFTFLSDYWLLHPKCFSLPHPSSTCAHLRPQSCKGVASPGDTIEYTNTSWFLEFQQPSAPWMSLLAGKLDILSVVEVSHNF